MKVYIVGTGAIGKALAVFLQKAGKEVILLRGSAADQVRSAEHIQLEMNSGQLLEATVPVDGIAHIQKLDGIVIIATKSFGNVRLAELLKNKISHSPLVILQNGLGVERPFLDLNFPSVYRCVLFVTSQIVDNHLIRFRPVSACPVGAVQGSEEELTTIIKVLSTPGFTFEPEEAIKPVVWKKTIVNSVFNSICPLLNTDNGIFHRNEHALNMAKDVITECLAVAKASGVMLNFSDILNTLLQISRLSDGQLISTLQDIQRGKPTEIQTLNMEIVRIADTFNMADGIPATRLLGELVQLKSLISEQ